jgi:hypothetical protein
LKRISSLDGFRAISIIIVILGHLLDDARVCVHQHFVYQGYVNGGLGVFIFFVISGYLITYLLLRDFDKWEPIIFQVMEAVRRDPIRRSDHSLRLGSQRWHRVRQTHQIGTLLSTRFLHLPLAAR